MAIQGILVDVDYCTGCEACILACQQEHGYSEKEFGIKITKLGPLHIDEANKVFQYDFIPQFTQWCDLCEERCGKGKKPTCVQHCQAGCLYLRDADNVADLIGKRKVSLFTLGR